MTLPQITTYATQKLAASVCNTAVTYCNDTVVSQPKDLYSSREECMDFLTGEVRFGEAYELGKYPGGVLIEDGYTRLTNARVYFYYRTEYTPLPNGASEYGAIQAVCALSAHWT